MLIPSSVLTPRASGRNTAPLSQVSSAQALFDLDATLAASYGGTGQTWANLIAAPDDGSAQAAYDFWRGDSSSATANDPAFNGAAGDAAAYWSCDGGDFFQIIGGNTNTLKNLHKTTGGASATFAIAFRTPASLGSTYAFGTSAQTNGDGVQLRFRSTGEINLFQTVNGALNNTIAAPAGALAASTDYLLFVTMDYSGGTASSALNARMLTAKTLVSGASTAVADGTAQVAAYGAGVSPLAGGYRVYGAYLFNRVLSNAQVSAVVDVLNSRHGRTYA
jgi:hypothetical protein